MSTIYDDEDYMIYLLVRNFSARPEDKLQQELLQLLVKCQEHLGEENFQQLSTRAKEIRRERKKFSQEQQAATRQLEDSKYQTVNQCVIKYVKSKSEPGMSVQDLHRALDFKIDYQQFLLDAPDVQLKAKAPQKIDNKQQILEENVSLTNQISELKKIQADQAITIKSQQQEIEALNLKMQNYKTDLENERSNAIQLKKDYLQANRKLDSLVKFSDAIYTSIYQKKPDLDLNLDQTYQAFAQIIKSKHDRVNTLKQTSIELKKIKEEIKAVRYDLTSRAIGNALDQVSTDTIRFAQTKIIKSLLNPTASQNQAHLQQSSNKSAIFICFSTNKFNQHPGSKLVSDPVQEFASLGQFIQKQILKNLSPTLTDLTNNQVQNCVCLMKQLRFLENSYCLFSAQCRRTGQWFDGVRLDQPLSNQTKVQIQNENEYMKVMNLITKRLNSEWDEFWITAEFVVQEDVKAVCCYKMFKPKYWDGAEASAEGIVLVE
ncbi:Conserved_hypothetical protein [Hexamita inflata]|uniref:Uncharacterized protein n=1 Tax=Hexamita inflata TaxID=28002 RepID=A0AA86QNW5_9EUKA|nr:Conserved hypothetical protein [Hexamita inflata]